MGREWKQEPERERGKAKGEREVLAWRFVMGSGLGFSEVVGDKQR